MPSLQTPSLAKLSPSVRWLRQEVISRSAYAEIERHFGRPSRDDLLRLELCRSRHAPILIPLLRPKTGPDDGRFPCDAYSMRLDDSPTAPPPRRCPILSDPRRRARLGAAQSAECLGSVSAGQDQMRLVGAQFGGCLSSVSAGQKPIRLGRFPPANLHPDTAFPPLRSAPEIH